MSRRLEQLFSTKTPSIRWREEEQTAGGFSKLCPEFSREKGKKERKEKEKRRKKGRRKEGGVGIHSNKVEFLSYMGYPCLGAIQRPWSLALTLGLVQKQFGTNCVSL